jgi:hypothetical protein
MFSGVAGLWLYCEVEVSSEGRAIQRGSIWCEGHSCLPSQPDEIDQIEQMNQTDQIPAKARRKVGLQDVTQFCLRPFRYSEKWPNFDGG